MATVKCILGAVVLFTLSVWSDAAVLRESAARLDDTHLSGHSGAFRRIRRNIALCLETEDCKWPKSQDGKVYVPYKISHSFSPCSRVAFWIVMESFSKSTCIRFIPKNDTVHTDFIYFRSSAFASQSDIGRRGGTQSFFLREADSVKLNVVQHELLHALGFIPAFEHSDRDRHVAVNWDRIDSNAFDNFMRSNTWVRNNPYDSSSVGDYGSLAGSVDDPPTLDAVSRACRDQLEFGTASQMSQVDSKRVYHVYCRTSLDLIIAAIMDFARTVKNYDSDLVLKVMQLMASQNNAN